MRATGGDQHDGPAGPRGRVLFVAGVSYARRFLVDLAAQLHTYGAVQPDLIISRQTAEAENAGVFRRESYFPETRPRITSPQEIGRTVRAMLEGSGDLFHPAHRSPSPVRRSFREAARRRVQAARYRRELAHELSGYDVVHYHTLSAEQLAFVRALAPGAKLVVSIWGSDLLRMYGTAEYADQSELCERADLITVSSVELREVLLAKFGRHLGPKVRLALLGVSLLDEIDRQRLAASEFRATLGLAPDTTTICVGNNSSALNRHLEVLAQLARLPAEPRSRCAALIPLSYPPPTPEYLGSLDQASAAAGIRAVLLKEQLTPEEVARLRCATDIMIHVPVSDAFSATMQEGLYAGAVLVTGAWLPYSRLRAARVHMHEIGELDELPGVLAGVMGDLTRERMAAAENAHRIFAISHPSRTTGAWLDIYNEALSTSRGKAER